MCKLSCHGYTQRDFEYFSSWIFELPTRFASRIANEQIISCGEGADIARERHRYTGSRGTTDMRGAFLDGQVRRRIAGADFYKERRDDFQVREARRNRVHPLAMQR